MMAQVILALPAAFMPGSVKKSCGTEFDGIRRPGQFVRLYFVPQIDLLVTTVIRVRKR